MSTSESSAGVPAGGSAGLLASKFAVPQLPPGLVTRHRLLERLDLGISGRVTLVSAGPGWGKTMLVASWAASRTADEPVAWLSLDPLDNDPVLFWSYLAAAVHRSGQPGTEALRTLQLRPPVGEDVVRRIALALTELERPLTLVLDDFGEIHSPEVLEGIADLLRHTTPLRLLLVTRTDPMLRLHRLRVDGQLTEVRAGDLAFTEPESDELLTRAGLTLSAEVNRRVLDRTEGWATGLRLAALYAADDEGGARLSDFTGTELSVADYLVEEVISSVAPERHRFLIRTCVADRICAELADVLNEGSGAQRELEDLEQQNAFVVALGHDRRWFRYHPLLIDLLRHRLRLQDPELMTELHRRTARWFAEQGEAVEAVRHAVRAEDWDLVADLMVKGAAIRAVSAERVTFAALIADIPAAEARNRAGLQVAGAAACMVNHDYLGFEQHSARARALLPHSPEVDRQAIEAFLLAAEVVLSRFQGDVQKLDVAAGRLLEATTGPSALDSAGVSQYEAPALSNIGVARFWMARLEEAERRLRESLRVTLETRTELTRLNSLGYLALLAWERGDLADADRIGAENLELTEQRGWTEQAQAIANYLCLARLELERNRLESAQGYLDAGLAAQQNDSDRAAYPALRATQARLFLATGHADAAKEALVGLRAELGETPLVGLQERWVAVAAAQLDLVRGRSEAAQARLMRVLASPSDASDEGTAGLDEVRVTLARVERALGDETAAEELLAPLRNGQTRITVAVEAWLLTALAGDERRDDQHALSALGQALTLAEPARIRRPFTAPGQPRVRPMLRHFLEMSEPAPREFVEGLLAELTEVEDVASGVSPLAEPLTDRERVVLGQMATLQTNDEIAANLFVSVNTIKAHARAVYRKLDAPNRRVAVARARDLGLI